MFQECRYARAEILRLVSDGMTGSVGRGLAGRVSWRGIAVVQRQTLRASTSDARTAFRNTALLISIHRREVRRVLRGGDLKSTSTQVTRSN